MRFLINCAGPENVFPKLKFCTLQKLSVFGTPLKMYSRKRVEILGRQTRITDLQYHKISRFQLLCVKFGELLKKWFFIIDEQYIFNFPTCINVYLHLHIPMQ